MAGERGMDTDGDVFVVLDADVPVAVYATRAVAERDAEVLRREATQVRGYPVPAGEIEVRGYPVQVAPRFDPVATDADATVNRATEPRTALMPPPGRHLTLVRDPLNGLW